MARTNNRGRNGRNGRGGNSSDRGVMELARDRPLAATAVAAGAAAAGLFLWSRRAQISSQLSGLSDQIGEWTQNRNGSEGDSGTNDDTAGLTTSSASTGRGRRSGRGQAQSAPTS
jgi:hypothetical protein